MVALTTLAALVGAMGLGITLIGGLFGMNIPQIVYDLIIHVLLPILVVSFGILIFCITNFWVVFALIECGIMGYSMYIGQKSGHLFSLLYVFFVLNWRVWSGIANLIIRLLSLVVQFFRGLTGLVPLVSS